MPDRRRLSTLPMGALRAFEAAARNGSFKAAALELSVTPAAISHQVKALEEHLGADLFGRFNRGLCLTQAGAILSATSQAAFTDLEKALTRLEQDGLMASPASLTITAAPSFAAKWLAPRLHLFQAQYPNIDLRVLTGDALVDLTDGGHADIALRYGGGSYGNNVHAEKLWPSGDIQPVCAASLVQSADLRKPADMLRCTLLRVAPPAIKPASRKISAAAPESWQLWFKAMRVAADKVAIALTRGPLFGNAQLALEAAIAGRGIALVPAVLSATDLASGRLVAPFDKTVRDPFNFWLAYAKSRQNETRIRAFAKWVREEASTTAVS